MGAAFYISGKPEQPLLLIGTGTWLAPLAGILHDALESGHTDPIHLLHDSREVDGLYRGEKIKELENRKKNFSYPPCFSGNDIPDGYVAGCAHQVALESIQRLRRVAYFSLWSPSPRND